jgi:hypothetical protein
MRKFLSKGNKKTDLKKELDRITKLLLKRDLRLNETIAQLEKQKAELDRITKMLIRRDFELAEMREKREAELKELQEMKEELENAKEVLEIKVKARTRELEELAQNLDEQVKARTKELQEKVQELEKFQNIAIGRELKMIELKKEIQRLKNILESYQKEKNDQ